MAKTELAWLGELNRKSTGISIEKGRTILKLLEKSAKENGNIIPDNAYKSVATTMEMKPSTLRQYVYELKRAFSGKDGTKFESLEDYYEAGRPVQGNKKYDKAKVTK